MKMQGNVHQDSYIAETEGHTIHAWARFYDTIVGFISLGRERKMRLATLELVDIQSDATILEVGCGTGSLAIEAKRLAPDGTVVGIDPSSNMVTLARQKAEKTRVDVEFKVGVIEQLEFPVNHFDVVLSSLMMHHLPDTLKREGLLEVYRVLKPGGILLIVDLDLSVFSLASIIHGHTSPTELSPEHTKTRQYMEEAGFVSLESGKLQFRGFSYQVGKKAEIINQ